MLGQKSYVRTRPGVGCGGVGLMVNERHVDPLVANLLTVELGDGIASLVSRGHLDVGYVSVVSLGLDKGTQHLDLGGNFVI